MKRRRLRKFVKAFAILCGLMLLCPVVAYHVLAAPTGDAYLLRVQVRDGDNSVDVSAPLSLIDAVFDVLPEDIQKLLEEGGLRAEDIRTELQKIGDEDLVRIEGNENVRIWLEPVTSVNRGDLGFVKVDVEEKGEHGQNIHVCVPRGLVQLAAKVIGALGITDEMVHLPPILKHAHEHAR